MFKQLSKKYGKTFVEEICCRRYKDPVESPQSEGNDLN